MAKISREELLQTKVGRRTLEEWDDLWEPLANPFNLKHSELKYVRGLFRMVLNGEVKYVSCASERKGIYAGLNRIGGPEKTGNSHYGAQMIRKHFTQVKVDILRTEDVSDATTVTKELKRKMVKLYDPPWGWSHKKRMRMIQTGQIPA